MAKRLTRTRTVPVVSDNAQPIIAVWVLRILVDLKCYKSFLGPRGGFLDESMLEAIGLEDFANEDEIDRELALALLKNRLQEANRSKPALPAILSHNLDLLGKTLGLDKTEKTLLGFAVLLHTNRILDEAADALGSELSSDDTVHVLVKVLKLDVTKVRQALSPDGTLASSGLLELDADTHFLHHKMDLLSGLADSLLSQQDNAIDMLKNFFTPSSPAKLSEKDYPHVIEDYRLIRDNLRQAMKSGERGVNILLHGQPGSGKNELVKAIAAELGASLYEIKTCDRRNRPLDNDDRFSAYMLGQRVLARNRNALVLFDEVDEVFPSPWRILFEDDSQQNKAWINHLLEQNPVPAFWLCNDVDAIGDFFLRRFDYVLPLNTPPRSVRLKILKNYLGNLPVSDSWLERLAEHENLTPAHIERCAKVAQRLKLKTPQEAERALERMIGNTLEAMGLPRKPRTLAQRQTDYRLDYLNADRDLERLLEGLQRHPRGRFCLFGAPGTGKTSFAHYLSRELDIPLVLKRASDLLDPYVGMTERRIAEAFAEAEKEHAMLLIDEADSLLRDRKGAKQSWEVTQVNELLTQMEAFDGIFIASTNLMDNLDEASLRRFDLKIKFNYLKPEQSWKLFRQVLSEHAPDEAPQESWQRELRALDNLTPGDFATVIRQARIHGRSLTGAELVHALQQECRVKPEARKLGIGFNARL